MGQIELHEISLDTLAGKCEDYQEDLDITKQALFQRMEAGSKLLKHIYNITYRKRNSNVKLVHSNNKCT
jgi:hypothetical protein